jgi:hypothetical protein
MAGVDVITGSGVGAVGGLDVRVKPTVAEGGIGATGARVGEEVAWDGDAQDAAKDTAVASVKARGALRMESGSFACAGWAGDSKVVVLIQDPRCG